MTLKLLKDSLEGIVALACATTVFLLAIADVPVEATSSATVQVAPAVR
jgi:hypothetical protein